MVLTVPPPGVGKARRMPLPAPSADGAMLLPFLLCKSRSTASHTLGILS